MQTATATRVSGYEGFEKVVFGNPLGCDRKDGLWGYTSNGLWLKLSTDRSPVSPEYPIQPSVIRDVSFVGMLGRSGNEAYAAKLVRFAQRRHGWTPFSLAEFNEYAGAEDHPYMLDFFEECGYLVKQDDKYHFTTGFVTEVFARQI